jgi:uncharacterized membrane protein YfcA
VDALHAMPSGDLGVLALGLVIAGIVGGLAAGILGVGAGIVVVPVLYHVMATLGIDAGVRMHVAVGTTLAAMVPGSLASVGTLHAKGSLDPPLLQRWAIPLIAGVVGGCALYATLTERLLAIVFGLFACAIALFFVFGGPAGARGRVHQGEAPHWACPFSSAPDPR